MAMNSVNNLFSDVSLKFEEELYETVLERETFRIERIVSHGHCSPEGFWYDQDEHEWVVLLKGSAVLRFESISETAKLNPGDYLHIDRHVRHRVDWTDPEQETVWLAIHYCPFPGKGRRCLAGPECLVPLGQAESHGREGLSCEHPE